MKTFLLLSLALLAAGPASAAKPKPKPPVEPPTLHSPWDVSPVKLTQAPYACPPSRPISPDITITNLSHIRDTLTDAAY